MFTHAGCCAGTFALDRLPRQRRSGYYRLTRIHFDDDRYDGLLDWSETVRDDVEAIDGLEFAALCRSGSGEGMVTAAYASEDDFSRATGVVARVMGGIAEYLTSEPHMHAGTSDRTFRRA